MMRLAAIALALLTAFGVTPNAAQAQAPLMQQGPSVGGHVPTYGYGGVVDSGYASGLTSTGTSAPGLSDFLQVNRPTTGGIFAANSGSGPLGAHNCAYSEPPNLGTFTYYCFDANINGKPAILVGGSSPVGLLNVIIDGTTFTIPGSLTANVTGPNSSVDGDLALFSGTTGKLLKDGGSPLGPASITLYASPTGVDTNNTCTNSGSPCTLPHACLVRSQFLTYQAGTMAISVAAGTYSPTPDGFGAYCSIVGNNGGSSESLTVITGAGIGSTILNITQNSTGAFFVKDGGEVQIQNMTVGGSGSAITGFFAGQGAVIDLMGTLLAGSYDSASLFINITHGGTVNAIGTIFVATSNNESAMISNSGGWFFTNGTWTFNAAGNWATAFLYNQGGWNLISSATFNGAGFATTAGKKYSGVGGCLFTGGTNPNSLFPGNASVALPLGYCGDFSVADKVANLPAASSNTGTTFVVSDATSLVVGSIVAGSGTPSTATTTEVVSDGTNWRVGGYASAYFIAGTPSSSLSNGQGTIGSGTSVGLILKGQGTGFDVALENNAGTVALEVITGTQNVQFPGSIFNSGIAADTALTDKTVCEDTTNHTYWFGTGTAGICLGSSSMRFKDLVDEPLPGLATLAALDIEPFHMKEPYGDPKRLVYGPIAETLAKTLPALVEFDAAGEPMRADYMGLAMVNIGWTQQLLHRLEAAEAEIDQLRHRLAR